PLRSRALLTIMICRLCQSRRRPDSDLDRTLYPTRLLCIPSRSSLPYNDIDRRGLGLGREAPRGPDDAQGLALAKSPQSLPLLPLLLPAPELGARFLKHCSVLERPPVLRRLSLVGRP